jgi:hypothetical protein
MKHLYEMKIRSGRNEDPHLCGAKIYLLLKSAFEWIFNVMPLILVQIK